MTLPFRCVGERLTYVDQPAGLHELVRELIGLRPESVGIWVEPRGPAPRHVTQDYRRSPAGLVGLALGGDDRPRFVVDIQRIERLDPLLQGLREANPYLVFFDAHAALHRLCSAADHPFEPQRIGCCRIAGTLLAEGTRRAHDLPDFDELCTKVLGHAAPAPPMLDAMATPPIVAERAELLVPLMRELAPMLRRRDLVRVHQLECGIVPAVVAMERAGFGVDGPAFERIAASWKSERLDATDPDRIARLDKLISTYAYWPREFVRAGRIHCRLHPLAADSGRFSCTEPNLQQVPSEHTAPGLRRCFVAAPEHRLVVADYAQIELRVAAHLAPCEALRRVFVEGRDPHRATAATLAEKPETDVTDHERKLAKAVNFGFLFGMGAARFRKYATDSYGLALDEREAERARSAFLRTFPGIANWHRRVGALGRGGRSVTLRTAMGRRKRFEPGRFSYNVALNIPVQGTAAEGFKLAMADLHPRLRELGGRGVLCVHDEYIAEVPTARAEEARNAVIEVMREAMASLVDSVPIEVEARVAESWS